ncbi:MAG: SUMF1/EgtB/PvdO family nonheme iron enzyme, partial [Oscillochloris sp.]|nr:SUMF1/EgtB/PvdO family nonheme iron enzyme [Oscillochloris sp.]
LVMEFIPGQNLDELLSAAGGPLPEPQVLAVAQQLCAVLDHLHSQPQPIIHRDIKPANVRLTPDGRIALLDFGLFKRGTDVTQPTRRGMTPAYAPLEQHPLAPGHTDQRSDIYSLGATLYHLLTGQEPIAALDRLQAEIDPLPSPERLNPQLTPHIAVAIDRAMRLQPEERYPDIATFERALTALPLGCPTPATSATRRRAQPTHLRGVGMVAVGLMALLATFWLLPRGQITAVRSAPPAPTAFVPEMVEVPAGPFLIGSSASDPRAIEGEKPQQSISLPSYEIGKTEVTNAQFRPFVTGDGYTNPAYWDATGWQWREKNQLVQPEYWRDPRWNGDQQPIVGVSWYEAMAYSRWLSAQTGQRFDLPTDAEWEKAARGSDGRIYPWGDSWDAQRAHGADQDGHKARPVGQYPSGASPYGALDMAGNVAEWTRSTDRPYPYDPNDGREGASDPAHKRFTLRGGSWFDSAPNLRAAGRSFDWPDSDTMFFGFRLVRHP